MQNVNECANCHAFHNNLEAYKSRGGIEDKYVDDTPLPKIEKYFRDCLACKKNLQAGLCSLELQVDQLNDDKTNKRYKGCATFDHYDESRALIEKKVTKLELQKLQGQNIKPPVPPVLPPRPALQPVPQYYNQYPVAVTYPQGSANAYQNQRAALTPQQQQQFRIQQQQQQQEQIRAQRQRQMQQFNNNVNYIQGRVQQPKQGGVAQPTKYKFKVTL